MTTIFLVTLYEYSPVFYIGLVSLCFTVTAILVLGWFGFDVPVVLHSSDESESVTKTPQKQMVQVTNPFALELGSGPASVTDGVSIKTCCLEPCVLSCFWGCEVQALQGALQNHQHNLRLSNPQHFMEALHLCYQHFESFHIGNEGEEEHRARIPDDQDVSDFGHFPRTRYPLVAVLMLAEAEARNTYDVVANVTVLHVPDDRYSFSARILFQYLLTSQRNMYELKPLFMSAGGDTSQPPDDDRSSQPAEPHETGEMESPVLDDGDWSNGTNKDCVICQNAAVNWVLLPCRHACVCDNCVTRFQHCPICRAFVLESFMLGLPAEP